MPPLSQEQIEFRAYLRRHLPMTLAEVVRESFNSRRHFEEDNGIVLQPEDLDAEESGNPPDGSH
ncbi:MAG: hypothetical protein V9E87_17670 [Gemmatimonadales bacterium]